MRFFDGNSWVVRHFSSLADRCDCTPSRTFLSRFKKFNFRIARHTYTQKRSRFANVMSRNCKADLFCADNLRPGRTEKSLASWSPPGESQAEWFAGAQRIAT